MQLASVIDREADDREPPGLLLAWPASRPLAALLLAALAQSAALVALADRRQLLTLAGVLTLVPPIIIMGLTAVVALRASRRAHALAALLAAERDGLVSEAAPARLDALAASLRKALDAGTARAIELPATGPILGEMLEAARDVLAAGRWGGTFEPRRELEAIWRRHSLAAAAATAVKLGLAGTLLRFAIQAVLSIDGGRDGGAFTGVFGESVIVSVLAAVATTIQGFLTASYVMHVDGQLATGANALARRMASFFSTLLLPRLQPADTPAAAIDAAVARFGSALTEHTQRLATQVASWVEAGLQPAVSRLVEAVAHEITPVAGRIAGSLEGVQGSLSRVELATAGLTGALADTGQLVLAATSALGGARQAPADMVALMEAAALALDQARRGLVSFRPLAEATAASLVTAAEQVAAASAALHDREIAAARTVDGLDDRVDKMVAHVERLASSLSSLAKAAFQISVGGAAKSTPVDDAA